MLGNLRVYDAVDVIPPPSSRARGCNLHLKLTTMDVPFLSSGAMNRAHYALVRNVEDATSPPMADQYILEEVENIRSRLSLPISTVGNTRFSRQNIELIAISDVEADKGVSDNIVILFNELHYATTQLRVRSSARSQSRRSRKVSTR